LVIISATSDYQNESLEPERIDYFCELFGKLLGTQKFFLLEEILASIRISAEESTMTIEKLQKIIWVEIN